MKNILLVSLLQFTFLNLSISQTSYNSQIEKLAKEISLKIDSSNHSRIAIMDFINGEKKVTQLGETISEDLSAELANYSNNQKKFEIFERSRVGQIFKEKNLIKTYDSRDAKELGKLNAVDILIIGTIIPFEEFNKQYYKVTMKLLDTKQGGILSSVKGQFEKNPTLDQLYNGVNEITENANDAKKNIEFKSKENASVIETRNIPKTNPCKTGDLKIISKDPYGDYLVLVSERPIEFGDYKRLYNQITVAGNSSEILPDLIPGTYYLCAAFNRYSIDGCRQSKIVRIEGCKTSEVVLN